VTEVCRRLGVSEQSFCRWKRKYTGMGVAELRRLKQLEEESRKRKKIVADLMLDKQMLQDVLKKSGEAGAQASAERVSRRDVPGQRTSELQGFGLSPEYSPLWKSCPGSDADPDASSGSGGSRRRKGWRSGRRSGGSG
jgi:putative transposase